MHRFRIFVSYTLRGSDVNYELLVAIKRKLKSVPWIDTYIDIVDNRSSNPQAHVMEELSKADSIWLIRSELVDTSIWVQLELQVAKARRIPIVVLNIRDVYDILKAKCLCQCLQEKCKIHCLEHPVKYSKSYMGALQHEEL